MRRAIQTMLTLSLSTCALACSENSKSTTQPANFTDEALSDPMNYPTSKDRADISGGGLGSYNHKEMKRDIDHVLDP